MIDWVTGEPSEIKPGMLLHYEDGGTALVGSTHVIHNSSAVARGIKRYAVLVPGYVLDWIEDMANSASHKK